MMHNIGYAGALTLLLIGVQWAHAGDTGAPVTESTSTTDINKRLDKIEQLLQNQALLDMLQLTERLQTEVNKLRGELDVQTHALEKLTQTRRDLYNDIDNRLKRLETGAAVTTATQAPPLQTVDTTTDTTTAPATDTVAAEPAIKIETVSNNIDQEQTGQPGQADTTPTPGDAEANSAAIQADYQSAFKLLREARYTQAEKALVEFLQAYPDSQYSDNAQFWLGETNYVMQQYQDAIGEYEKLLQAYPDSQKVAQALLKIGYSYYELGNLEKARTMLKGLVDNYPGATAARLARDRLKEINAGEQ